MATCPRYVETIGVSENVGDSLIKINNNFKNLEEGFCKLKKQIDSIIQIRTFFYYGPNSTTDSTSGMQDNVTSRPSNTTIENFINSSSQLNLPQISRKGDIAYVIYQKTGYLSREATRQVSGTVTVPGTQAVITGTFTAGNGQVFPAGQTVNITKTAAWSTTSPDRYNVYSPVFFIWRLNYNGIRYTTEGGFPKISQAETLSTTNWNNPRLWAKY